MGKGEWEPESQLLRSVKDGSRVTVSLPGMKQWIQIESCLFQIDNPAASRFLIQIGVVHQQGS